MSYESDNEEGGLQLVSTKSVEKVKEKSEVAKTQKRFIDEVIDFRVKMQNLLVLVNRLPQGSLRNEFVNRNEGIAAKTKEIKKGVSGLLDGLLESDSLIASKLPEIYQGEAACKAVKKMQSETSLKDGAHYLGCVENMIRRKRTWEEATVDHWNKRIQIQLGKTLKLSALNKNIFEQVDNIMEDEQRWRKRCTVLRGGYQIIGEVAEIDDDGLVRNSSVYDDQEFYNSLLNQYAALSMNRNASVIKQRNSKKKEIQRKASKGRRLIYTAHPKLQNFCAPEKYPPVDMNVEQLFSSLFGKNA